MLIITDIIRSDNWSYSQTSQKQEAVEAVVRSQGPTVTIIPWSVLLKHMSTCLYVTKSNYGMLKWKKGNVSSLCHGVMAHALMKCRYFTVLRCN